ncbi:lipopolysaccharide export system protein LptA [Ectothiorhodospira mobilis]|uniref:Lipopolysaccharide export system protein LptA n=1 Tax=Ectothiorhodospira mobilis TaxID=195064 RepID=A0A1I4R9T6_ECTMO|nr:lipopolysaccharide transport periplasmic protein LptA [Ectothiorhodospira mobilis]SFM48955.1 lipopolysaccharide export system protein LptA [Ectothiorhodospira mobilis]
MHPVHDLGLRPWALLLLPLLLWASGATAQQDTELPVHVEADRAHLDDRRGISIYRGNVTITQGDTVIRGDVVTVHSPERELERMEAEGEPARLDTLDKDGRPVHAEAQRMTFLPPSQEVILSGNARILQSEDEFRGDRIVYDLEKAVLEASTGETGRVEAIFTPGERPAETE